MYCRKCGRKMEIDETFCSECGTKVDEQEVKKDSGNILEKLKSKVQELRLLDLVLVGLFVWILFQWLGSMLYFWTDIFLELDWLEQKQKFLGSLLYEGVCVMEISGCVFEITEIVHRNFHKIIPILLLVIGIIIRVMLLIKEKISVNTYGIIIGNMAEDYRKQSFGLMVIGGSLVFLYFVKQKYFITAKSEVQS